MSRWIPITFVLLIASFFLSGLPFHPRRAFADEKNEKVSKKETDQDDRDQISFNKDIRPILTKHCTACHGGVKQAGDVSFVYPEQVLPPDGWVIEPGDAEGSVLIQLIKSDDPSERMPPAQEHPEPLPPEEIELLERWINEGAKWGETWALSPLDTAHPDTEKQQTIESLVESKRNTHSLTHSPPASPSQWLRRASLDIVGLPPSIKEITQFVSDSQQAKSEADLERVYSDKADQLLASKHFGERWASVWMDLARYADSQGFEKDTHRDMWPYRDWLIRAFNSDMPYDQFSIKQLAGDLVPNPTADDIIATAYHRNTQTNAEGGTDDEEFRVAAVVDRVNTTWTVWQGLTMGCVQCHSHPYDPIRHDEYYSSMAFFDNTVDADLDSDYPTLKIPTDTSEIEASIDAQRQFESARHLRNQIGFETAGNVEWKTMTPLTVASTSGRLKIDGDFVLSDGGTFPVGVSYTVEMAGEPMTAIRIEILPKKADPEASPEKGAVLSHLAIEIVDAQGKTTPVPIADVFVDSINGDNDPRDALAPSSTGVGEFPKLNGPRTACFILKKHLIPNDGETLRLTMHQKAATVGNVATPIHKFRWSASSDEGLIQFIGSDRIDEQNKKFGEAKKLADRFKGASLPVIRSRRQAAARKTQVFKRGNWMDRGAEVKPGVPEVFHPDGPFAEIEDRLQFATWLVSEQNPLAARVWANRIWAQLFGLGLVETLEDFGSSGLQASHPELLDHLARKLTEEHGWHFKPFLKDLVLSDVYRQTNVATPTLQEKDPRNRWLARGPRTRLSAEMVRDLALSVSGLLNEQLGGPSVMPPQPEGVWQTVYSGAKWETATDDQRYRRAVYTYWRRTSPYPSFLMFDSPTRDICSARRIATNTPLQALVTLNDPVYVECARRLAQTAIENGDPVEEMIDQMVLAATGMPPSENESNELRSLYCELASMGNNESNNENEPSNPTDDPSSDIPSSDQSTIDPPTIDPPMSDPPMSDPSTIDKVALSIVANTILNLDKALTK